MGQALYRKYRSKSLDEVVGQEHITTTLSRALKSGKISHAYLFTGPRGVGKTSVARILAHEISGIPYDDEHSYIDIIEIDAASNNGVEDVRDLREKVYVAPAQGKYKVYIIDEVHMLSKQAFNALLKTLEEPPAHVVFILATTEAYRLPDTIVSRTQRFVFRPIEHAKAVAHLKELAKKEGIDVTADALELIAQHGGGSFRDSIGLLDQLGSGGGKIDLTTVQNALGLPPQDAISDLLAALNNGPQVVGSLNNLYDRGYMAPALAEQLSATLREQLVNSTLSLPHAVALGLLAQLLEVPISHNPERFLEIVLLATAPAKMSSERNTPNTSRQDPRKQSAAARKTTKDSKSAPLDKASWAEVLTELKHHHNTLYGIVRMAQPDFSDAGVVTLAFAFAFHQKHMNESKNQQIIAVAVAKVTGQTVAVRCTLNPDLKESVPAQTEARPPVPPLPEPQPADNAPLATISNIFGGGELLQSSE